MLIDDNNLYDICFPEGMDLVGISCLHKPLEPTELYFNRWGFFYSFLVWGESGGDYEVDVDLMEGLLILKPLFFYKRDGDGVTEEHLDIVDQYGGIIIKEAYDIIEYEKTVCIQKG